MALLSELRAKAYAHFGACATGLTDYYHRHASASNCSECGERDQAEKMVRLLEKALGLTPKDIPCYFTQDHTWCISHGKSASRCRL